MITNLLLIVEEHPVASLLVVGSSLLFIWWNKGNSSNLPPGPRPLPLLGNVRELMKLSSGLGDLRKKYGDIFRLRAGFTDFIVVSGYDTLKDLFVKHGEVTSDRPDLFTFREITHYKGIISSSGKPWKQQRTFCLSALREFGFGKKSMEYKIMEEVDVFLEIIKNENGKACDIDKLIQTSISNVMCSVVFGNRFDHHDKQFERLLLLMRQNMDFFAYSAILNIFPFLKHIPGDPCKCKRVLKNAEEIIEYINEHIEYHRKTLDINAPRDLIDVYLTHMQTLTDEEDKEAFSDEQLMNVVGDLFFAGTDTTATVIQWAIVFFIHNPKVQERMNEELERVVGSGRPPSLTDRDKLHYCQATLTEVLRLGNIAPNGGAPHATSEEFKFKGLTIPKGAMLLPDMTSVLYDANLFENPKDFKPERFINEDGEFYGSEHVISFFFGRRRCLGELLSRSELFLFITNLVQRFRLEPEDKDNLPSLEPVIAGTRKPRPYKFHAIVRE